MGIAHFAPQEHWAYLPACLNCDLSFLPQLAQVKWIEESGTGMTLQRNNFLLEYPLILPLMQMNNEVWQKSEGKFFSQSVFLAV